MVPGAEASCWCGHSLFAIYKLKVVPELRRVKYRSGISRLDCRLPRGCCAQALYIFMVSKPRTWRVVVKIVDVSFASQNNLESEV